MLALRDGHGGLGIFDGMGLANADEIVMPLTPHHVAVLGQGDEVDRYNTLQTRLAFRYVYFRPASSLAAFVRSLTSTDAAA